MAIDSKKATILVLIDLSKAFDLVVIDILLAKMRILNIYWFSTYLSDRSQFCLRNSHYSSMRLVEQWGQGILGSMLFSLYLQNLSGILTHRS
ncbi:hypothetical protein J437_LFUL017842 [Ladona fulva]|uniref:Reverse transcriptase domain-containing protein n=1 Tax=Ladona fulva TaxID=123851 RepID=A0A8K0P6Y4_LADFU|nr:hypothetical protein J437_LFUL017842 [Ladona fulva]